MAVKRPLVLLLILACASKGVSQQWKTVTSFTSVRDADLVSNDIWAATSGGILHFDLVTLSEDKYANTEGLFSNNVVSIVTDSARRQVIAAHMDGTLQLLNTETGSMSNLYELRGLVISDLVVWNHQLLVASTQGMAVVDLVQRTVVGSVNKIGNLPANTPVIRVGADAENYWCATSTSVGRASRSGNFQVPGAWSVYDGSRGLGGNSVTDLEVVRDTTYAMVGGRGLVAYEAGVDSFVLYGNGLPATDLKIACLGNELAVFGPASLFLRSGHDWSLADVPVVDGEGRSFSHLFLMRSSSGLLVSLDELGSIRHRTPEGPWIVHRSNSPAYNFFSGLKFDTRTKTLWCASTRGYDCCGGGPGFAGFDTRTGQWMNFNKNTLSTIPYAYFYNVDVDPQGRIWLGSWTKGAIVFDPGDSSWQTFDGSNGLTYLDAECPASTLVNEIFFDNDGKAWISVQKPCDLSRTICVFDPNSSSFAYHSSSSIGTNTPGEMLQDQFGRIWTTTFPVNDAGIGMAVYSTDSGQWARLDRNDYPNLVSNNTTAVAEDRDGNIWIGTTDGLQTYSPYSDEVSMTYRYPDGPVNESISDIVVDRFNNKWIGTAGGLSLLAANGEWVHFTKENSGLVGNNIGSIAVNDSTGEVYIGTYDEGMSILKHPAAQSNPAASIRVYPNPFIPEDHGAVYFAGVPSQAVIKIFTVGGELVQTVDVVSSAQRISWDGRTSKGLRASSGIYIYHVYPSASSSARFSPTTGKFAIIRR